MNSAAALIPAPAPVDLDWLPGLADIDLGGLVLVTDGSRPIWRHVSLQQASRSQAFVLDNRLELKVATGNHAFALALIAAFATPADRPAAAAPESRDLLALAARVAARDISILIQGATGTGKEGLAHLVHTLSPRRDFPLVAVNCAALPETMLEATLFGHERGAFTGANAASRGLFRAAHGGTLFLDEVSELPLGLQAKLLRALQEREVLPIGATKPEKIDVRIIACANRDLAGEVAAGRFRADLFYRLAVFPLRTWMLAERPEDIIAITAHWLLKATTGALQWPTPAALDRLLAHDWPGNVRELGNVLDRALVLAEGAVIDVGDLVFDRVAVADAAVVVVNPTHFAVAMRYQPGSDAAPVVLEKGRLEIAQAIIAVARKKGVPVTRSSNVIDDLVTGVRITARKADPLVPVQISAARDGAALSSTVADFAATLGAMRSLIGDFRKGASGTDPAGALANDATARAIDQRIVGLVTAPVAAANGLRLRDLGINIARDGSVALDAARFAALSPTRYADAEALLKALASPVLSTQPSRLQSIAELATPASLGLTRQRTAVTSDLARVDVRLATYRTNLTRQYAAMDRLVAASNAVKEQPDQQIALWSRREN